MTLWSDESRDIDVYFVTSRGNHLLPRLGHQVGTTFRSATEEKNLITRTRKTICMHTITINIYIYIYIYIHIYIYIYIRMQFELY
jgi:hypothetical protein